MVTVKTGQMALGTHSLFLFSCFMFKLIFFIIFRFQLYFDDMRRVTVGDGNKNRPR